MKKKINRKELNKVTGGTAPDLNLTPTERCLLGEEFFEEVEKARASGTLEAERSRLIQIVKNHCPKDPQQTFLVPLAMFFASKYIDNIIGK